MVWGPLGLLLSFVPGIPDICSPLQILALWVEFLTWATSAWWVVVGNPAGGAWPEIISVNTHHFLTLGTAIWAVQTDLSLGRENRY